MVNKYYDFTFELTIDGVRCPSENASPMFQTDPFPAGYQYSCVISGARLGKYFNYLPIGRRSPVSSDEAFRFFTSLGLQWEDKGVRPKYFLNSVDELDFDGDRVIFSGVCSRVISSSGDA